MSTGEAVPKLDTRRTRKLVLRYSASGKKGIPLLGEQERAAFEGSGGATARYSANGKAARQRRLPPPPAE